MTDYGHELRFGTFLPAEADAAPEILKLARLTEELGLDLVSVQDHPYQGRFLDAWTLLSVIAAQTSTVSVFPNVANLPLRPPAVLARAVASLDVLSGGRAELALGAGAFWDAIVAMGGPRRSAGESVAALEEAVRVLRALWTPGRGVRVDGEHYALRGAHPGPAPAHPIGVWVGGYKPRMLQLVGRVADGWLPSSPYLPPERLAEANLRIDESAVAAGREPRDVRRLYNIVGSFSGNGSEFLRGGPKVWVEQLAELALTEGMGTFILMVQSGGDADLRRFAEEVVPEVRTLVAAERAAGRPKAPDHATVELYTSDRAVGVPRTPDRAVGVPRTQDRATVQPCTQDRAVGEPHVPDRAVGVPRTPDHATVEPRTPDRAGGEPLTIERAGRRPQTAERGAGQSKAANGQPQAGGRGADQPTATERANHQSPATAGTSGKPHAAERAGGQPHAAERAGGQLPAAERANGQPPAAEGASGKPHAAERAGGQLPAAERANGQLPAAEGASGQPHAAERASGQSRAAERGGGQPLAARRTDQKRSPVWDESTRPTGPAPDPDVTLTAAQRATGQHLVEVHDHLRQELDQVRDLVRQVAAGAIGIGHARSMINTMTMRQNNWTLGTYCESYCRVVTTHHTIEDVSLFPRLRAADPRLVPVVDRLEAEHHVIAGVLEQVDAALVALVADPARIDEVREAVDLLTDTLLSHLAYEERELVEPLGRLQIF